MERNIFLIDRMGGGENARTAKILIHDLILYIINSIAFHIGYISLGISLQMKYIS